MGHLTKSEIEKLEKIKRLNIINAVTGIKPANLIGTIDSQGNSNLSIFSSIIHLGSNPALLGFILRPNENVRRHTYENIIETNIYTINHVHKSFVKEAHFTSAKFDKTESEFEKCGLTEEYLFGFRPPFVKESKLKLGMRHLETIPISLNKTLLVIGQIEHLIYPEEALNVDGHLDLSLIGDIGVSGLQTYYELKKIAELPYARPGDEMK